MNLSEQKQKFVSMYGDGTIRSFFSPGRVNLIGEHIDYNGGYVFPCALELGIFTFVKKRNDNKINISSFKFSEKLSIDIIDEIKYNAKDGWTNYPKGVIKVMKDMGYNVGGMDILIDSNLPSGAGLASSAALELLIAVIINHMFNEGNIPRLDLIRASQIAENDFIGVNCGIMDQFAVGLSRNNNAILLNCNTLEYEYVPISLGDYNLVIMNSNKTRVLNESKYNERRKECEIALNIIHQKKDIMELCDLTPGDFNSIEYLLEDEIIRNRVKHVVYENDRVNRAFSALKRGDLDAFGRLLVESHNSLRDLYEVTGVELDTLVEEAINIDGCIGARMTGAGFGGCAIAIVNKNALNVFFKSVKQNYKNRIGYEPCFYLSSIKGGAREL